MLRDKLGETSRAGRRNSKEYRKKMGPRFGVGGIAACTCLAKGHALQRVVPGEFQQPGVKVPTPPKPACFSPPGSAQFQEHLWTLHWAKLDDGLWAPGVSQPT